jgi:arsenite-transporting ATPase
LRLRVPFVEKAEIDLKKIGLELVVRVGAHKRNILLPSALASFRPREAKLEDGALRIRFAHGDHASVPAREAV